MRKRRDRGGFHTRARRRYARAEAENAICAFEFGKLTDIIGE